MNFFDILLTVMLAIFVFGAIIGNEQALSLLVRGGEGKFSGFKPNAISRILSVLFICISVFSYVGYRILATQTQSDYGTFQEKVQEQEDEAAEKKRIEDAAEKERKRIEERTQFEERVERLEGEVEILRDEPNFRLVQAVTRYEPAIEERGQIEHTVVRHMLDDAYGSKQLAVVYHLFDEAAHWSFNRSSETDPIDFFDRMATSSLPNTFGTYELIVGIGLGSNSTSQRPDIADKRAQYLCGFINSIIPMETSVPIYGLSLGDHSGPDVDTSANPYPKLRPIIIAGVAETSDGLDEEALMLEMMLSFDYSGIDLRSYSALQNKRRPFWYELSECNSNDLRFRR